MSITSINGAARSRRLSLWIAALTALLVTQITACGGGGGSSGGANTASTSTSITEGTVNGFASVIVDGQEVEDATSTTRVENADGSFSNVALKLGQRVHVTQSVSGAVTGTTSILVQAALIGSVSNTTLSLQLSSGTEPMLVDANTYFEQPSASLIDQPVDVEGVLITGGSMLRAKAVKRAR